jgi:hypothetical protein
MYCKNSFVPHLCKSFQFALNLRHNLIANIS